MELSPTERETLLCLARGAIEDAVRNDDSLRSTIERAEITPPLHEPRGVFVTLKQTVSDHGREVVGLRGCIGTVAPTRPLFEAVVSTASAAAMRDPRFSPVEPDELASLRISISVLTPTRPLERVDDISIGRHGVQLIEGANRSVFLPQVAVEQRWSVDQLLRHLALKAGLPAEGWRKAELSVFEAEVFAEGAGPGFG